MRKLATIFTAALLLLGVSNLSASPIPIEEEFVAAQQLHVDASWDVMVIHLLGEGFIESGTSLHYEGIYEIEETSPGLFTGSYGGMLTGTYLDEDWSIEYSADMYTDALLDKIWDLKSKGKWKKGPYKGKDFTDKGKLTEKTDNKADLDIEIETDGVSQKLKTTAKDLKKEKKDGKLTVSGDIEITDDKGKKHKEKLVIELDQANKTFTSKVTSTFLGIVILENSGKFTAIKDGTRITGSTSFDMSVAYAAPEPNSLFLLFLGLTGLAPILAARRRRGPYSVG